MIAVVGDPKQGASRAGPTGMTTRDTGMTDNALMFEEEYQDHYTLIA